MAVEESPDRADTGFETLLLEEFLADLIECQVRCFGNEAKQPRLVRFERRARVAFSGLCACLPRLRPTLEPANGGGIADFE